MEFNVISGKLFVGDPAYETYTWCTATLTDVKNGIWIFKPKIINCGEWGERVSSIMAFHKDYVSSSDLRTEEITELGVDSGQLGIFDYAHYKDDSQFDENVEPVHRFIGDDRGKFYGFCSDLTLGKDQCGVIPYGCVAASGYGDGVYNGLSYTNDECEVVGVTVFFINEDDEDVDIE